MAKLLSKILVHCREEVTTSVILSLSGLSRSLILFLLS